MRRTLFILILLIGLFAAGSTQAAFTCSKLPTGVVLSDIEQKWISVAVPIPGVTTTCTDSAGATRDYIQDMGAYIGGLYKFFSGAIGIIATVMIFYGGIKWVAAAGNPSKIKEAKEAIFSALIAVVISLGSYMLLYVINPNLVNLRPPSLTVVKPIEQRFATCPTSRTCLSGAKAGTKCTLDADCGSGAGACGYPIELGGDTQPLCGTEYPYTAGSTGAATCRGTVCADTTKTCGLGSDFRDGLSGQTFLRSDPVNGTKYGCMDKILACEQVDDTLANVGLGRHDVLCAPLSQPGSRQCSWYAAGGLTECGDVTVTDYCKSWPVLTCPSDFPVRVGGEACRRAQEPDATGSINFGTKVNPSIQFTGVSGSCYDASAAEEIYDGTLASTGKIITSQCEWRKEKGLFQALQVRGICCMKATANATTATAVDLTCHVSE
ncbi:MAG: pilin [Patescibacteria group bacterium]